ncbi:YjbF family lipoprotein [Thalassobius vesicularis]|uniref:YjbF family lipoprotein n=1 Tax=Thalassobius vesicularis TaxID=1294297 RepID=A0A4S3MD30_9RHOB|nr:YjbF family lipoprotein [Thalassobius vesicularis]THD76751.1 YjbF family lipoprotein [Thalassobius vesicularis]
MIRTLALLLLLAGCTQPKGIYVSLDSIVSRRQLDTVETPLIAARLTGAGTLATMIPAGRNGDVVTWRSGDGVSISLQQGLLVATRGMGDDLMAADVRDTLAMLDGQDGAEYTRIHTYLDGEYQPVFKAFRCREELRAADRIEIVERQHDTTRVEETCFGPQGSIANTFWIGADGTIWKSKQWISPGLGYMETELLVR